MKNSSHRFKMTNYKASSDKKSYTANLLLDDVLIAKVLFDLKSAKCSYTWTKTDKTEAEIAANIKKISKSSVYMFLANLMMDAEHAKTIEQRFRALCKKQTLFKLKTDKPGASWRCLQAPYTDPRAKAYLEKKYGNKVGEILNLRYM